MEFIYTIYNETYKILLLLIPILHSVALIVWFDRRVWGLCPKEKRPKCCRTFWFIPNSSRCFKIYI